MTQCWQTELKDAVTSVAELYRLLQLPDPSKNQIHPAAEHWPLRVPQGFLQRMEPNNPSDPLLLQVLPQASELVLAPGYTDDPLSEAVSTPQSGILHKYHGRALLMLTGSCAVHCRYCFRREFDYAAHRLSGGEWEQAIRYLRQQTDISEVILSGGDPLMLGDERLTLLLEQIASVAHVDTVRIHSRLPVVLPSRMTDELLQMLQRSRLHCVMVIHSNHANELNHDVAAATARMKSSGLTLLNQSVLLKGVNDKLSVLESLSRKLFEIGVLPYYLHQLDKVTGSQHFEVDERYAADLYEQLRNRLPGYLLPRFVAEIAGECAKQPVRTV